MSEKCDVCGEDVAGTETSEFWFAGKRVFGHQSCLFTGLAAHRRVRRIFFTAAERTRRGWGQRAGDSNGAA